MKQTSFLKRDLWLILLGTAMFALGVTWFADPFGLVIGGFTGISILVKALTRKLFGFEMPIALTNAALNVPLFLISIRKRGFSFVSRSLVAVIWMSIAFWLFPLLPNPFAGETDLLLAAILCGALSGTGIALVLQASATTGGADMLASILKSRFPQLSMATLILTIDAGIIAAGVAVFGAVKTLYAMIAVYVTSKTLGNLLDGMHFAKAAWIVSEKSEEISRAIFEQLHRGNTGIPVRGMYRGNAMTALYVVVGKKEVAQLRRIVEEIDTRAFLTVSDVREALGEGFAENTQSLTK